MKRRRSDCCWLAPRSRTSAFASSPVAILASAGVHLEVGIPLEAADLDEGAAIAQRQPVFGAAIDARAPAASDHGRERFQRRARAQRRAKIDTGQRVEAQVPHAVGGETAAIAVGAERGGGGGYDTEHGAVGKPVAVGRRGAVLDDRRDSPVTALQALD